MPMKNIRVLSIADDHKHGLAVAQIRATSTERIKGRPVASVRMQVRIEAISGEPRRETSRRAKDEALTFLELRELESTFGDDLNNLPQQQGG